MPNGLFGSCGGTGNAATSAVQQSTSSSILTWLPMLLIVVGVPGLVLLIVGLATKKQGLWIAGAVLLCLMLLPMVISFIASLF